MVVHNLAESLLFRPEKAGKYQILPGASLSLQVDLSVRMEELKSIFAYSHYFISFCVVTGERRLLQTKRASFCCVIVVA